MSRRLQSFWHAGLHRHTLSSSTGRLSSSLAYWLVWGRAAPQQPCALEVVTRAAHQKASGRRLSRQQDALPSGSWQRAPRAVLSLLQPLNEVQSE